jgi:uncharacterized membrane protein SpoIIM required for sporulation
VIVDLKRFIEEERPYWQELEAGLEKLRNPASNFSLEEVERLHYLYRRTSSDLMRMRTYAVENELQRYLEQLVAQFYAEMHGQRTRGKRFRPLHWLRVQLPQAVRKRSGSGASSLVLFLIGAVLGAFFLTVAPETKKLVIPFAHLHGDPADRVALEETFFVSSVEGEATFAAELMEHNIRISLLIMAMGFTWGIGTAWLLFYNGIVIGAVVLDYIRAGQLEFLLAWLLPHGSVEIPAILFAGQAGFLLASALIGRGGGEDLEQRFRGAAKDAAHIAGLVVLLLIWAGIVEAFLSQQHGALVSYPLKIAFGSLQLLALGLYIGFSGRRTGVDHA